jgi:hypothetical protein
MKEITFEPMSIGRILDYTFKIYKDNFLKFIAIVAVVVIPVQLLVMLSQQVMYADLFTSEDFAPMPYDSEYEQTEPDFTEPSESYGQEEYIYDEGRGSNPILVALGAVGTMVGVFLAIIGNKLSQGALTHSVSKQYLGEDVTIGVAYRYVGKRLLRLIGAAILVGLIVFAGLLLFVVPGIIFSLWYAIVVPVIIEEDCRVTEALSRSKNLVAGNLGKVFSLGLLIWLIGLVVQVPFQILGQIVALVGVQLNYAVGMMLSQVCQMIGQIIAAPIGAAAFILLYYDLRIRKEGFDLEMLAGMIDEPGPDIQSTTAE